MKKIKHFVLISLSVLSLFSLVACGNQNATQSPTTQYIDGAFIVDLGKALETRFEAADKLDLEADTLSNKDYLEKLSSVVDIEISALSQYKTGLFENTKLQELAISYLNALEDSKKALSNTDALMVIDQFEEAQKVRRALIVTFVNDYGLTVGEKYQSDLDDIISNAKQVAKEEETKQAIESVLLNLTFEEVENSYGYKTYRAVLENTSGSDLEYVNYSIDLLDASGVVIEQTFASLSNVTQGKKYNVDFSTNADFEKYELTVEYTIKE